jgi:hypothetical protein
MVYRVGEIVSERGSITTLNCVKPGAERSTEAALGFHPGRLSMGYQIGFPLRLPRPKEFQFDGTTLRSDGRLGLPLADHKADKDRVRVHQKILDEHNDDGYESMQLDALAKTPLRGANRICKVFPVMPHSATMPPSVQYPMGGGFLQWRIIAETGLKFKIAVDVAADGVAHTPEFSVDLIHGGYDARARLRRYMEGA